MTQDTTELYTETDGDETADNVAKTADEGAAGHLETSRRTALQLLSAGAVGASGAGSVAAFDVLVEEEFGNDPDVGEWILRVRNPLGATPEYDTVATARTAAFETQEPVLAALDSMAGVSVLNQFWGANAILVEAESVEAGDLRGIEGVRTVHPNFEVAAPEPVDRERLSVLDEETTYGLTQVAAPAVWETFGTFGEGTRVAVLDTGAHEPHTDIEVDGWAEFDEDGDAVDSQPHDPNGHGTHVAGTAVGRNEGLVDIGVAPAAEHYHAKVFPGSDRTTTFAAILAGMEWAAEADSDLLNTSLGAGGFVPAFIEPVRTVQELGTLVVASSGNQGADTSGSPGNVYDSTAVGATDEHEAVPAFSSGQQVYTPGDWSFFAPDDWPTWYVVPDVAAPGEGVRSAATDTEGGYELLSGTSMAAPHVTGVLALALSADADVDIETLQELLAASSVHPDGATAAESRYGTGIANALNAVMRRAEDGRLTGTATLDTLDGEASATGADVRSDLGTRAVVDGQGSYEVPVSEGVRTVEASTFGFETEESIDVEGETDLDLTLDAVLDVALRRGQPPDVADGDTIELVLDVAHLESVTVELAESLGQRLAVETATLADGVAEDTLFQVDVHPTDEDGELLPGEFVGATEVVSGETESTEVTLVDEDGEETSLDPGGEYVAMVHIVDPDAVEDDPEEGSFYPPGTFPVLPAATPDGLVGTGVTDGATIEQATLAFQDQAVEFGSEDPPHAVVEGVDAEGETVAVIVTYPDGEEAVVAGFETRFAPESEDVPVELEATGGFPGIHTAHVVPTDDLSGEYDPGDTLSAETAEAIQDDASAQVYGVDLSLPDQEVDPAVDIAVAGESVELGDPLTFDDPLTAEGVPVEVTVTGAPDGSELTLEHTFAGLDEEVTVTTGPTTVRQAPEPAFFEIVETNFDGTVGGDGLLESSAVVQNTGELTAAESVFFFVGDIVTEGGTPVQELFEFSLELGPGESALLPLGPISFGAFPRQEGTQLVLTTDPDDPDDTAEGSFLVEGPLFELVGVTVPKEVDVGQDLDIEVALGNAGEMEGNAGVAFEFAGRTVASVAEPVAPGEVTAVELSVATDGLAPGSYDHAVVPEPSIRYDDPTPVEGTVQVVEPEGPPALPGFDDPPQDLNDDGLFEDIDGDGQFTIFDVQAFFNHFGSDAVQNNVQFFDFNDDDQITIFDVQALFNRLQNWGE